MGIVLLVLIVMALSGLALQNWWEHKERMKKIEMGIDPDKDDDEQDSDNSRPTLP